MRLIHTNDGIYYRRWVNLIPSFVLSGSAQFLSGRKRAGILWFVTSLFCGVVMVGLLLHPKTSLSMLSKGGIEWIPFLLWLIVTIDGFRRPMPCLHFKGWAILFCIYFCIWLLPLGIRQFLIRPFNTPSSAMQPTLMGNQKDKSANKIAGDHFFVNKLIYRFSSPQRGDVIVHNTTGIKYPHIKLHAYYVKRLVGLPGETISIEPPYVMVNGNKLTDPPIFRKIAESQDGYAGYCLASPSSYLASPSQQMILGPDEYLILGDNSKNSLDGRYFGPISRKAIIGKAFYIYAPADRKRRIE